MTASSANACNPFPPPRVGTTFTNGLRTWTILEVIGNKVTISVDTLDMRYVYTLGDYYKWRSDGYYKFKDYVNSPFKDEDYEDIFV